MELEEAIKKLKKTKKVDLISLIRQFKREGIENFVVTRPEIIETVLNHITKQEKMIDLMAERIEYDTEWFYSDLDNKKADEIKQYFKKKAEESDKNVND